MPADNAAPQPPRPITIDGPHLGQSAACEPILRALPGWFGIEESIVQYVAMIDDLPTWLARPANSSISSSTHHDHPVGFISIKSHFDHAAEIAVLGIRRDHHRHGVGRRLVLIAEAWLADRRVEYLQVKTLGPSRPNAEYESTRNFYAAVGFRPLEEFPTLWNPRNPCLLMVKRLGAT